MFAGGSYLMLVVIYSDGFNTPGAFYRVTVKFDSDMLAYIHNVRYEYIKPND
jgi:hypothetical protein